MIIKKESKRKTNILKRLENSEIFSHIKYTIIEYYEKIDNILIQLNHTGLTEEELRMISGTLFCTLLDRQILSSQEYNDNHIKIENNSLCYYNTLKYFNKIWEHIYEYVEEGNQKIFLLSEKYQKIEKRKILTIDNVTTLEECDKLASKYLDYMLCNESLYDIYDEKLSKLKQVRISIEEKIKNDNNGI